MLPTRLIQKELIYRTRTSICFQLLINFIQIEWMYKPSRFISKDGVSNNANLCLIFLDLYYPF